MIESIFKSYLPSKKWLEEDYPKAREEFFYSLPWTTVAAISYEEFTGGLSKTNDEKMAIIADEMMYFDARHEYTKEQCKNNIKLCLSYFEQVSEEHKDLFHRLFMYQPTTHIEVAKTLGWSRSVVTKTVKREIERISAII